MFIQKQYGAGDTVTLKLSSGEEIVGRLDIDGDEAYHLKRPMTFMMGPQGLGLTSYLFSAPKDSTIAINKRFVISIIKTDEEINKAYIKQTTGLHI